MKEFIKWLFKILGFFLILSGIFLLTLYLVFSPKLSGRFEHSHHKYGNISIRRDENGIPHIKAKDMDSGCYGQGFATAQDRLFNMHVKRELI